MNELDAINHKDTHNPKRHTPPPLTIFKNQKIRLTIFFFSFTHFFSHHSRCHFSHSHLFFMVLIIFYSRHSLTPFLLSFLFFYFYFSHHNIHKTFHPLIDNKYNFIFITITLSILFFIFFIFFITTFYYHITYYILLFFSFFLHL